MTYVNSLISTGRSSNSVFLFATTVRRSRQRMRLHHVLSNGQGLGRLSSLDNMHPKTSEHHVRSASLPSFSIVPVIPLPISAALLANSDRAPFLGPLISPFGDPFAALLCDSVSRDCLCWPIFVDDCRFCACARTVLNSAVRSCMDVEVISTSHSTPASVQILILRRPSKYLS